MGKNPKKKLPGGVKEAGPGARERVFKKLLYDSGFVASKTLYGAVSEVKESGESLGPYLEREGLITAGQHERLQQRTDWFFCDCPNKGCGKRWEFSRLPSERSFTCPRCKESVELAERELTQGRLMILKPQKIKNMILGKLAMKKGFVTREQLDECFEIHAAATRNKQLAQVFIDQGYLPGERVGELLTEHNQICEEMEGYFNRLVKEIDMVDKLVARGLVGTEEMNRAIEQQSKGMAQGKTAPLVKLLVKRKALTPEQGKMIATGKEERMVHCPGCNSLYLVRNLDIQRKFLCKNCGELVGGEERAAPAAVEEPEPPVAPKKRSAPEKPAARATEEARELPALEDSSSGLAPLSADLDDSDAAITVQPRSDEGQEDMVVELKPIGEESQITLPVDWDEDQVVEAEEVDLGFDEPDAADFLDDDFMVSDHLEAMSSAKLAEFSSELQSESVAREVPALGPDDSVEELEVVEETDEDDPTQSEIDRLTAEIEKKKAEIKALRKKK